MFRILYIVTINISVLGSSPISCDFDSHDPNRAICHSIEPIQQTIDTPFSIGVACPSEWTYFHGTSSCYYVGSRESYQLATNNCLFWHSKLVWIESPEEQLFVAGLTASDMEMEPGDQVWIGLRRTGGVWKWSTGEKAFNNVPPLFDSNFSCGILRSDIPKDGQREDRYKIASYDCYHKMRKYVCRKKMEPVPRCNLE